MSKTTDNRYEVSGEGYGVLKHVRTFDIAVKVATHWLDEQKTPATIFDRMAHIGNPDTWSVTRCTGAAHSNPFIDHCGICMPRWEVVVRNEGIRLPNEA